jgi:hypothetical protein
VWSSAGGVKTHSPTPNPAENQWIRSGPTSGVRTPIKVTASVPHITVWWPPTAWQRDEDAARLADSLSCPSIAENN